MADTVSYAEKHIEDKLSHIGAKVVEATEKSFSATKLLQDVQTEIADLYETLGDVLVKRNTEKQVVNDLANRQQTPRKD